VVLCSFYSLCVGWGWLALYPGERDPVPSVSDAGGPHSQFGRVQKISPPPVRDPRPVQALVSRCTDDIPYKFFKFCPNGTFPILFIVLSLSAKWSINQADVNACRYFVISAIQCIVISEILVKRHLT
jgi:hypothetical protein